METREKRIPSDVYELRVTDHAEIAISCPRRSTRFLLDHPYSFVLISLVLVIPVSVPGLVGAEWLCFSMYPARAASMDIIKLIWG